MTDLIRLIYWDISKFLKKSFATIWFLDRSNITLIPVTTRSKRVSKLVSRCSSLCNLASASHTVSHLFNQLPPKKTRTRIRWYSSSFQIQELVLILGQYMAMEQDTCRLFVAIRFLQLPRYCNPKPYVERFRYFCSTALNSRQAKGNI